jgi:hypothetical protein
MPAPSAPGEAQVYTVVFRYLGGATTERKVITDRGEFKAVYIATRATYNSLPGGEDALDVVVRHEGPPPLDSEGAVRLSGFGFDRNEW